MEPVKITRHTIRDWRHSANNPPVRSPTVKVRVGPEYGQVLLFFLTRGGGTEDDSALERVSRKLAGLVRIFYSDIVREFADRVKAFLRPIVRQEEVIPAAKKQ